MSGEPEGTTGKISCCTQSNASCMQQRSRIGTIGPANLPAPVVVASLIPRVTNGPASTLGVRLTDERLTVIRPYSKLCKRSSLDYAKVLWGYISLCCRQMRASRCAQCANYFVPTWWHNTLVTVLAGALFVSDRSHVGPSLLEFKKERQRTLISLVNVPK